MARDYGIELDQRAIAVQSDFDRRQQDPDFGGVSAFLSGGFIGGEVGKSFFMASFIVLLRA